MDVRVDNRLGKCPSGCHRSDIDFDVNEMFSDDGLMVIEVVVDCRKRDVCDLVGRKLPEVEQ